MPRLLLLGGPPGVGKTTLVKTLRGLGITCVEADEISPPGSPLTRMDAITRVIDAAEHALDQDDTLVLTWVFARSELYGPFRDHFAGIDLQQVYLVCSPPTLKHRLNSRGSNPQFSVAMQKLELINALPFDKIDTTGLSSASLADKIVTILEGSSWK